MLIWIKGQKTDDIISRLESEISTLNNCFKDNCMLLNKEKSKYMIIEPQRLDSGNSEIRSEECTIRNSNKEKLRGLVLDKHLKFDHHVKKIIALARIASYLDTEKRNLPMK